MATAAPPPGPIPIPLGHPAELLALAGRAELLIDAGRQKAGLPILRTADPLNCAGFWMAADMAARGYFDHGMPGVGSFVDRLARCGYDGRPLFEIIAAGQATPEAVVAAWMASPPHRAAILAPDATHFGLGVARAADGTPYWCCDFGRPA